MAVHQYIGARYVPKFYENSLGTSEWQAGVIYEPLTIVTYNGNSYTSKKPVPANVGNPSANPTYWVATGIFNEQLADVSERLSTAENEISNLQYKNVVLISDSYGNPSISGGTSWEEIVETDMTDRTITSYYWGGAGFGWDNASVYYFPTLLSTMQSDENVDLVVLLAGANDGNLIHGGTRTRANIAAGLSDGITIIKNKFPNAKIKIGFVGRYKDPYRVDPYAEACKEYIKNYKLGYEYITNSQYCLYDRNTMIDDQNIHPSLAGTHALADMAKLVINGGEFNFTFDYKTGYGTTETIIHVHNDEATMILRRVFTDSYPFVGIVIGDNMTPYSTIKELTQWFPLQFTPSENSGFCNIMPLMYTTEGGQNKTGAFMVRSSNNRGLVFEAMMLDNGFTSQYVNQVLLPQEFTIKVPTLYC